MAQKQVKGPMDIPKWLKSQAHKQLIDFLNLGCASVKGLQMDSATNTAVCDRMNAALDSLSALIDQCPRQTQPQRYGNSAFRDWCAKMIEVSESLLLSIVTESHSASVAELNSYFAGSFGNSTRIDYGTGHEASFVVLLSCLHRLGVIKHEDMATVVLQTFPRYLSLVRRLQLVYQMEPAGSQGVWALDDHQFVPYIWGAAQLIDHPNLSVNSFLDPNTSCEQAHHFMFFACIEHINKVKSGVFAEHSNQLWNISAVPSWTKVCSGLIKMYNAEVLSKFPVVQHFLFGPLFPFDPVQ